MSQGYIDEVQINMVVNGVGYGDLGEDIASGRLSPNPRVGYDPGMQRPVIMPDGQRYLKLATGKMITNKAGKEVPERKLIPLLTMINNGLVPQSVNNAALPHRSWYMIDKAVIEASRDRLQAWSDLEAVNTLSGFDGMAVTSIARDTATDAGAAKVVMEQEDDDFNDASKFTTDIMPLPIITAGSSIPARRLAESRRVGMPLDTRGVEQATRRCTEALENITIGMTDYSATNKVGQSVVPAFSNQALYGFRTHPDIITDSITASSSFVAETFVTDILGMIELARAQKFFGPFLLYLSTDWDQHLAKDYVIGTAAQGYTTVNQTVLERVERIRQISRVQVLDLFSNSAGTLSEILLVQQQSETMRAVVGMEFAPIQWQHPGTGATMLRVIGIKAPDIKSQYVGTSTTSRKAGIVLGS